MSSSARAARTARRQNRLKGGAALNITALMDIFTILVFFLLVNSQNPGKLPDTSVIKLPVSKAETDPKENLVVMVTKTDILVQDVKVASVEEVLNSKEPLLASLAEELKYRASISPVSPNAEGFIERDVTILSDKSVSYNVLRKIMATCSDNDYSRISFGVIKGGSKS